MSVYGIHLSMLSNIDSSGHMDVTSGYSKNETKIELFSAPGHEQRQMRLRCT